MTDAHSLLFLAEIDRFAEMGNRLRTDGSRIELGVTFYVAIGAILAIAVLGIAGYFARRAQMKRPAYLEKKLFFQLCRIHAVGRKDRKRLVRLAEGQSLDSLAEVFVRPDLFELPHLTSLPSREWPHQMRLRDRLFAHRIELVSGAHQS